MAEKPIISDGEIILAGGVKLRYDNLESQYEEVTDIDSVMEKNWGRVYRLALIKKGKEGSVSYKFTVI